MGPGRLTGMNVDGGRQAAAHAERASMGPGRLTGMNDCEHDSGTAGEIIASMGPGRLTGMNAVAKKKAMIITAVLQWGPVD